MPEHIPVIRGYTFQQGVVVGTYINPFGKTVSVKQDEIKLIVGEGVVGDNHAGPRLSDTREDVLKAIGVGKEVPMANVRQISIVSQAAMEIVIARMGLLEVEPRFAVSLMPELLGANLMIDGISVDTLPSGSLLTFAREKPNRPEEVEWHKAVIAVWASNEPCKIPHQNIVDFMQKRKSALKILASDWSPKVAFAKAAKDLRGVVCFVYSSGKIKPGDICVAYIPE